jgi:hypothetical protein
MKGCIPVAMFITLLPGTVHEREEYVEVRFATRPQLLVLTSLHAVLQEECIPWKAPTQIVNSGSWKFISGFKLVEQ